MSKDTLLSVMLSVFVSSLVTAGCFYVFNARVIEPSKRVGVVDVADIYRTKEREYVTILTKAGSTEADKQRALAMANQFASALPKALEELSESCACNVFVKGAVASKSRNTIDLTEDVRRKVAGSAQ